MSKLAEANQIINSHVVWATGAGSIPLPIIDIAAVTAVQLDMLKQLAKLYDISYSESSGKSLITAIAGSTLARIGASFIKGIPVVGTLLGGISMAVLSGASTYATGQVFARHLESGGTFFDFDAVWGKKQYEEEFKKGQQYASDLEKKSKEKSNADIFEQLEKLVQLKKSGVLTEEEFKAKKDELMKQL